MMDQEKIQDYEHVCAVAGAGFSLHAECQRISVLIKHHNLEKLIPNIDPEKMFAFVQAVDQRGKAHRQRIMEAHPLQPGDAGYSPAVTRPNGETP